MRIQVFVGTGGVGKTSVAAAAALRAAIGGEKSLVLTIDPARRLRTALGITGTGFQEQLPLDPFGAKGELWAAQLDVAQSLNRAVEQSAPPRQAAAVLAHPIYHILLESLAGMQELMAVERMDQALDDGFQALFVDTAPSRHALEFVDKPEAFAQLVSFPMVKLVGMTYQWWERLGLATLSRKSLELYSRVEQMLGAPLTRQILDFFSIFRSIAEDYAKRARRTLAMLRNPEITTFTVVTTPFKARRDGDFFWEELSKRKFPVGSMVVNRVWPMLPELSIPEGLEDLRSVAGWYQEMSQAHQQVWERVRADFGPRIPKLIEVPELSSDIDGLPALHQIAQRLEL
ncbi:MAG: ArsA family ATPase [Acidobacteria bacterium]|nr:ArsA family ATPase [Acidobacteriota bacterium]